MTKRSAVLDSNTARLNMDPVTYVASDLASQAARLLKSGLDQGRYTIEDLASVLDVRRDQVLNLLRFPGALRIDRALVALGALTGKQVVVTLGEDIAPA